MMFAFRATPDNGDTLIIEAGMRDLRMWEKTHKGRALGQVRDSANISATVLYEIAFSAARRQGMLALDVNEDAFGDTYDIEPLNAAETAEAKGEPVPADEDGDDEDPTHAGA
jgi:hypothetical protein